jgi:rhodanese-related sulfurtransferase
MSSRPEDISAGNACMGKESHFMSQQQNRLEWDSIPGVSPEQAWQRLQQGIAVLVDVREPDEYALLHAERAISMPLSVLGERYQEIPREGDLLLICHIGERSLLAAAFLRRLGWDQVFNVEGGTDQWEASRLPLQRGNGG